MLIGIAIEIPFALGEALLGFEAYFIRDWTTLQIVAYLPLICKNIIVGETFNQDHSLKKNLGFLNDVHFGTNFDQPTSASSYNEVSSELMPFENKSRRLQPYVLVLLAF